ncbi:MAG: VOC family protein [Bacteroidia bacterium]
MGQPHKRVLGIGGIFFTCQDPEALKAWYRTHLGMETDAYGVLFRSENDPPGTSILQWSPFPADTTYFAPSDKPFMINYRVADLVALVDALRAGGGQILDEIETYEYGKFVHILDPENNKIELWEPVSGVLG